jgi:hypothetical protein
MSKFSGLVVGGATIFRLNLVHPITGNPLVAKDGGAPAWIDLLSLDSAPARDHDRALQDRAMEQAARGRKTSAEEVFVHRCEKLAKLSTGWNLVWLDGTPADLPFATATAAELYAAPGVAWLREQAEGAVYDRANFWRPPSTT